MIEWLQSADWLPAAAAWFFGCIALGAILGLTAERRQARRFRQARRRHAKKTRR